MVSYGSLLTLPPWPMVPGSGVGVQVQEPPSSAAGSASLTFATATLGPEGTRQGPCPHRPIPPDCLGKRQTVYRFGVPGHGHKLDS